MSWVFLLIPRASAAAEAAKVAFMAQKAAVGKLERASAGAWNAPHTNAI